MANLSSFEFTTIVRNTDYVVTDHVLHGVHMMPGVTFLDMIYRILHSEGISLPSVELRKILFKEPITTAETHDKQVVIQMEWKGTYGKITASSQKVKDGHAVLHDWAENFECELHLDQAPISRTIDIAELKCTAQHVLDMDAAYAVGRNAGLYHYQFMKCLGDLHMGTDYVLAELHLSELAEKYRNHFLFHPAFLDGSTCVMGIFARTDEKLDLDRPFIPMYADTFRMLDRVTEKCYVYVRKADVRMSSSNDIAYTDFELYNDQGALVAAFKRFGSKRVRSEELVKSLVKLDQAPIPVPPEVTAATTSRTEAAEAAKPDVSDMKHVLRVLVGELLNKHPETVDTTAGFYDQGLDSGGLLKLVQGLEQRLGRQLYPTLLFEYTNIDDLSRYLVEEVGAVTVTAAGPASQEDVQSELRRLVGALLNKRPAEVDIEAGFYNQGLDSAGLLKLVQELEQQLGEQLYPTLLFEYTNIRELAGYLAKEHAGAFRRQTGNAASMRDTAAKLEETTQTVYLRGDFAAASLPPLNLPTSEGGPVLLFDTDSALRDALRARLGGTVPLVLATPGSEYQVLGPEEYVLDPASKSDYQQLVAALQSAGLLPARVLHNWSKNAAGTVLNEQLELGLNAVLFFTQALLAQKPQQKVSLLYTYEADGEGERPLCAALSGFNRTLQAENPKLRYKTVELLGAHTADQLAAIALQEWHGGDECEIRYAKDGQRLVHRLQAADPNTDADAPLPLRKQGVYLITGGLGGLGLLFAKYLAERWNAKLVLTGRSALSAAMQKHIAQLQALGSEVLYVQADVSNREDVEKLLQQARARFAHINGLLHSAGVIRDSFVPNKTAAELQAVLAPKVLGALHLDEGLQDEPLDFMVYFSSAAALIGNAGQSDYAFANRFLDHFAAWREAKRVRGERHGRTISINWPIWRDGGMQVDEQKELLMKQRAGLVPLSTASGLGAFETAFRLNGAQVLVMEGDRERVLQALVSQPSVTVQSPALTVQPEAAPPASQHGAGSVTEEIAIIGLSGRYPQSQNITAFWDNLRSGKDCITEIPPQRWDNHAYFNPDKNNGGTSYCKWGGFIEDADKFDPLFFQISPREAVIMDPQERLFLQSAWEVLEDAGYTRHLLARDRVGVFVGVMWGQYQLLDNELNGKAFPPTSVYASIPNRVSYFFNFNGPSVALDTMCSSSLTSLHFAVESIRRGECTLAIAGGVNLSLHPDKYIFLSNQKALSADGRCQAFGAGGDGYVPGEGVGCVLLKPLSKALADGDQIYAVVRGTAINAGGKTSGFSVPSPVGQANVITDALKKANINARTITYLEAHGTGTSLGDPIEINGLKAAFAEFTSDKQFCAIGSVKSNVGHCESAAGIAAITKVLLQLKHRQLVPSLHAEALNTQINFADSPFWVQRELQEWKRPVLVENGVEKLYPRRAGISSFGAGGSNAHIILEEYVPEADRTPAVDSRRQVVVLSARTEDRLVENARQLYAFLQQHREAARAGQSPHLLLRDLAYTLQTGREAMEARIAFVSGTLEEAAERLGAYLSDQTGTAKVSCGNTTQSPRSATAQVESVRAALHAEDYERLAELWTAGAVIDWPLLHQGAKPHRVSAPTYSFARERYWVTGQAGKRTSGTAAMGAGAPLHPLLDTNESTLSEQVFKKTLRVDEFFIKDHVVAENRLLPGAAYLELVRAAGELAGGKAVRQIKDVIWAQPVAVEEQHDLYVGLYPQEQDVVYEVYSKEPGRKVVHSQGRLVYAAAERSAETEKLDLEAVKRRCTMHKVKAEIYQAFREAGFAYGSAFRVTEELYGSENEALAKLVLPSELQGALPQYGLHPSLLDGIFRSVAGIGLTQGRPPLRIPFSLGQMDLNGALPNVCYAYARIASADKADIIKYDIVVLNEQGDVLVRVRAFSTRLFKTANQQPAAEELLFYAPTWRPSPLPGANSTVQPVLLFDSGEDLFRALGTKSTVLVQPGTTFAAAGTHRYRINPANPDDYRRLLTALSEQQFNPQHVVHSWTLRQAPGAATAGENVPQQMEQGLYSLLFLFQAMTERQPEAKTRCLFAFPHQARGLTAQYELAAGFANSLTTVNHRFELVSLQVDPDAVDAKKLASLLKAELAAVYSANGTEVRYEKGQRLVHSLQVLTPEPDQQQQQVPLKQQGAYLITGGAGGLGMIFAEYLAKHYQARLLLTGRSELTPEKQRQIAALSRYGAEVHYCRADVGQLEDVRRAVATARKHFNALDGVFHSAGITGDTPVLNANQSSFAEVLLPKVQGTQNLDLATQDEQLDLFVLFSSVSAVVGDFGGCSYAAANTFMDRYATWRAKQQRSGLTLSINWPLWSGGGMELPADEAKVYFDYTGMKPMAADKGLQAFETALRFRVPQVVVVNGDAKKVNRVLKVEAAPQDDVASEALEPAPGVGGESTDSQLSAAAEAYLKELLSRIIALPAERIQSRVALENYGIDSVMIMEINQRLEKDFAGLPKTLLFEYGNLYDLAHYFATQHAARLREVCGLGKPEAARQVAPIADVPPESIRRNRFVERTEPVLTSLVPTEAPAAEDIAVIGVSGRYPMADDLDQFWQNLCGGRDCIMEIPPDRWDYRDYFDPRKGVKGKTYSKWGGFIKDVDRFDALFFKISPREADTIDPQERLFLETAWNTLEDAGYTRGALAESKVGVFVGAMYSQYQLFGIEETAKGNALSLGSFFSSIANRVSYVMNFNGPSLAVDTACSSALEAIRLGCEQIRSGACDVAIAGGVNLTLHPHKYLILSQGNFFSTDGRCRSFGAGGDGYVPGEGVGAVLLKPLSKAIADGDHIYAVIKGWAVNHGGKTNGYSVPNPNAQGDLIAEAFKNAHVDARTVSYIEAHGTGTALGDPIEITGLTKAFGEFTDAKQFCSVGAVKSNIGHLEAAAGIASVTKVLLQLQHKQLVPSLHSQELNPNIAFPETPFYVQQQLAEWKPAVALANGVRQSYPRRAGVSGFGAGGTNVHLVFEEYNQGAAATAEVHEPQLIVLSARNESGLQAYAGKLHAYLSKLAVPSRQRQVDKDALANSLQEELVARIAGLLDIRPDEIDVTEPFLECGFDAVSLSELGAAINDTYQVDLQGRLFSEHTTLERLARYMVDTWSDLLGDRFPACCCEVEAGAMAEEVAVADVAYTLQLGREALDQRLAFVVSSLPELCEKLGLYCAGKLSASDACYGNVKAATASTELLSDGEEGAEFVRKIIERKKLAKLANLWVSGVDIDWKLLHRGQKRQRVSLPGYPFAGERHWFKAAEKSARAAATALHPLIDKVDLKRSLQAGLVFQKTLTPLHPVVADYRLHGKVAFPPLACLEMAFAAAAQVGQGSYKQASVVWLEPLTLQGDKANAELVFRPGAGETVTYELRSTSADGAVTHTIGELQPTAAAQAGTTGQQRLPLSELQARCTETVDLATLNARLLAVGEQFGAPYQVLHSVVGNSAEALGALRLAPRVVEDLPRYTLPPALLAGVHQTIVALLAALNGSNRTQLFSVREVEVLQTPEQAAWVYVQALGEGRFHAALLDQSGLVCARFQDILFVAGQSAAEPEQGESLTPTLPPQEHAVPAAAPAAPTAVALDDESVREFIAEAVINSVVGVLQMNRADFDPSLPYNDFGVDSIMSIEIVNRINQALQIEIRSTELFNYPTANRMSDYIFSEFGEVVRRQFASRSNVAAEEAGTLRR